MSEYLETDTAGDECKDVFDLELELAGNEGLERVFALLLTDELPADIDDGVENECGLVGIVP